MENPFAWKIVKHHRALVHEGIHAVIARDGKYFLVQRNFAPHGFSNVAGHLDWGETPEQGLAREVREEIKCAVKNAQLVYSAKEDFRCPLFFKHFNYVFKCEIEGEPQINFESRDSGWFLPSEISKLRLTPFTFKIFQALEIIS